MSQSSMPIVCVKDALELFETVHKPMPNPFTTSSFHKCSPLIESIPTLNLNQFRTATDSGLLVSGFIDDCCLRRWRKVPGRIQPDTPGLL